MFGNYPGGVEPHRLRVPDAAQVQMRLLAQEPPGCSRQHANQYRHPCDTASTTHCLDAHRREEPRM